MIGAIVTAVGFWLVGAAVRRLIGGGARFLLGLGTTGLVLHVALLAGVPPIPVLVAIGAGSILTLFLVRRRAAEPPPRTPAAAWVMIVAPVVFLLFVTAIVPLADYDGRAFWLLKAKAIAVEGEIDGPYFSGQGGHNPKNEYPLLVPLAAAAVMITAGDIDDMQVRWIYVLALGSLALHARRWAGAWPAALITWLPQFAVEPQGSALSAYNDIVLAAFAACAFFEIVERTSPLRFGVWISFLVLTKNEGLPFAILLLAAAAFVWRGRVLRALPPFALALTTLFVWRLRVQPTDDDPLLALLPTLPERLERLGPAVAGLLSHAASLERWGLFWFAVVAALVLLAVRREWQFAGVPVFLMAGMSAVYVAAYMVTTWHMPDHIAVSADRLLMHLVGPAVYLLSAAAARAPLSSRA